MFGSALILWATIAGAAEVASLKACTDKLAPGAPWAMARTVRVETAEGAGTGTVVSPDGFVITAAHVISTVEGLAVVFQDGSRLDAVLVRSSVDADLALLRVDASDLACMPVDSAPVEVGSDVLVIGSPGGKALSHSVSKGIVSGYREVGGRTMVQTDASINPGNSGGPLVGPTGTLAGVVSFKLVGQGVEGLGFAVSATNIPAELSIRWGTMTDDVLRTSTASPPASVLVGTAMPVVDLGKGVELSTDKFYRMAYRPRGKGFFSYGTMFLAGGITTLVVTNSEAQKNPVEDAEGLYAPWRASAWSGVAVGGALIGFGFALPAKNAPVMIDSAGGAR